jgi:hypothetical protein
VPERRTSKDIAAEPGRTSDAIDQALTRAKAVARPVFQSLYGSLEG